MPPRISRFIIPPSGWKFPDKNIYIYGETFNDLVKNVIVHRQANGYPPGNPDKEIEEWLTLNNKDFLIRNL